MAVQEINVYVTDGAGGPTIQVDQPIAGVHSGSPVLWEFHSVVPNVTWAQIEFAGGAQFFEARPGAAASLRYARVKGGHGEIMGTAPELPNPSPKSKKEKYWIRVFSGAPGTYPPTALVKELDPDIIICDP